MDFQHPKSNKLQRIFNKNTIKISYSCLPNVRSVSNSHNKKILETENKAKRTCNCRNKTNFLFNGECLLKGVYIAKVREKEYIGSTGTSFKTRWQQHKHSILKKAQTTALAKFTASNNIDFSKIIWLILFKTNCLAPKNTERIVAPSATWKEWLLQMQIEIRHLI